MLYNSIAQSLERPIIIAAPPRSGKSYLATHAGWLDADVFLEGCALPHGQAEDEAHQWAARRLVSYMASRPNLVAVTDLSPRLLVGPARRFRVDLFCALPSIALHKAHSAMRLPSLPVSELLTIRQTFNLAAKAVSQTTLSWDVLTALITDAAVMTGRQIAAATLRAAIFAALA